jgi:hypothetical protein
VVVMKRHAADDFARQETPTTTTINNDRRRGTKRSLESSMMACDQCTVVGDGDARCCNDNNHNNVFVSQDADIIADSANIPRARHRRRLASSAYMHMATSRIVALLEDLVYGDDDVALPSDDATFLHFLDYYRLDVCELEIDAELCLRYLVEIEAIAIDTADNSGDDGTLYYVSTTPTLGSAQRAHDLRRLDAAPPDARAHPLAIVNSTAAAPFLDIAGDVLRQLLASAPFARLPMPQFVAALLPLCCRRVTLPGTAILARLVELGVVVRADHDDNDDDNTALTIRLPPRSSF